MIISDHRNSAKFYIGYRLFNITLFFYPNLKKSITYSKVNLSRIFLRQRNDERKLKFKVYSEGNCHK